MSDAKPPLKRRNILLMIVLALVTFGFYFPAWYLRRRAALNALASPRKLPLWPFLVLIAYFVLGLVVAIATSDTPADPLQGEDLTLLIVRFAVGIMMILQNFRVKDILEDHLSTSDPEMPAFANQAVSLSGVLTFIFGPFYLQHAINSNLDALNRPAQASGAIA